MKERFFLVWRDADGYPQGNTPKFKHFEHASAVREAQRFARQEPGTKYFVVEAVSFDICEISEPKHTILPVSAAQSPFDAGSGEKGG